MYHAIVKLIMSSFEPHYFGLPLSRTFGADRTHRQTPMPAQVVRTLIQTLDPCCLGDLVLGNMLLMGITCFLRLNSYHALRWRHLIFSSSVGPEGDLHVDILVSVPDLKAVAYVAALGGMAKKVRLFEFALREMCVVRSLVALGVKMGVFDTNLREAVDKQRFVLKPAALDWYLFPAVEGGHLNPTKTVSMMGPPYLIQCPCHHTFLAVRLSKKSILHTLTFHT